MKLHRKYRPYIRLANGRERSSSIVEAFRLAFYQDIGKPFYVMVQRGVPNYVIAVGKSRREVQMKPASVAFGIKTFREWAKSIQEHASRHL